MSVSVTLCWTTGQGQRDWPLTLCPGSLLQCRQVLFGGVGVDGSDDGGAGRQLAPRTYLHLLARTPLDMSNTPATRSAPPLHHPPVCSAGMTVFLLLPVTSLMVNGVLTALLHPSPKPSLRSLSPLKCVVSLDVGVWIKSTLRHWLILIILWAAVHGRPWRSASYLCTFYPIIKPNPFKRSQLTDQKHHKSTWINSFLFPIHCPLFTDWDLVCKFEIDSETVVVFLWIVRHCDRVSDDGSCGGLVTCPRCISVSYPDVAS